MRDDNGHTLLETLLILILVGIFVIAALDRYYASVRPLKETALTIELQNLRSAVNYFAVANGRLPASLKELVERDALKPKGDIEGKDYMVVVASRYVEGMSMDNEGYPTDPFGNRFRYDMATGAVSAGTKGYERW